MYCFPLFCSDSGGDHCADRAGLYGGGHCLVLRVLLLLLLLCQAETEVRKKKEDRLYTVGCEFLIT